TYPFQRSRYVLETPDLEAPPAPAPAAPRAAETSRPEDGLYRVEWHSLPSNAGSGEPRVGRWLIFADRAGVARSLAERLGWRGSACVLVETGRSESRDGDLWRIRPQDAGDFKRLLASLEEAGKESLVGVVHAWSLDAEEPDRLDAESLRQATLLSTASTLHLI